MIFSLALGVLLTARSLSIFIDFFGLEFQIMYGFLLATLFNSLAAGDFTKGTVDAIKSKQANMDSLIAIGTSATGFTTQLCVSRRLWPQILPKVTTATTEVYFTESSLIIGFILLGKYLEHIVKGRASQAIRTLIDLQPKLATVSRDGKKSISLLNR